MGRIRAIGWGLLLGIAGAGNCQGTGGIRVDEAATRLSFPGNHFLLDLPVDNAGPATTMPVKAELLGLKDEVGSQATTECALGAGVTHCRVEMPPEDQGTQFPGNSVALLRVRYKVAGVSGILALEQISPDLYELHVAGPENVRAGGNYAAHIRALHPLTGQARGGVALSALVTASFEGKDKDETVERIRVRTNARGFATVAFTAPGRPSLASLSLKLEGTIGNLHLGTVQTFNVPECASTDLTTDKPLYQPGQTVHTRVLLLDRNGHARGKEKVQFDFKDPDSTLVFRAEAVTSSFGIATADWTVPATMRLGQYRIAASPEDGQEGRTTIRLSRYDLPTFTVDPKPDQPLYLPGADAVVEVRANYLFGKPVLHGHVRVVREDQREWNFREQRYDTEEGKVLEGELDADGKFSAHVDLAADAEPYKDSEPSDQFEDVHLAAYVTDASTGRTEQRRFDVRVTQQALHLYLPGVDSSGRQQSRGLPQLVYLTVTTADGVPAEVDADVMLLPIESASPNEPLAKRVARARLLMHVHTNARGLARIDLPEYEALRKLMPAATDGSALGKDESPYLYVAATDRGGRTGSISQELGESFDALRVSTAKSLYRPGDAIDVTVESGEGSLPVTVDLVRRTTHGDVVLASRDVTLSAGTAKLSLPTDAESGHYSGMLFVSAYSLRDQAGRHNRYNWRRDADDDPIVSASRAILFPRDNTLHVDVRMSKATYKPGEEATATLTVRGPQDPDGDDTEPDASALGVVAVDQAVEERNRTDSDFGNANDQSFFFRWRSYIGAYASAGGVSLGGLEELEMKKAPSADLQLAAEIVLRGLQMEPDTADTAPPTDLGNIFADVLNRQLAPVRKALADSIKVNLEAPTTAPALAAVLAKSGIALADLRDPWGDPYEVVSTAASYGGRSLELRSSGPDKQRETKDDFSVGIANWSWLAPFERDLQRLVNGYHDRTGGFIRDMAALREEAGREGMDVDGWRDPWDRPFDFVFEIAQSNYLVSAKVKPDKVSPDAYRVGADARISYFNGERARIENVLNQYAAAHPYPTNEAELEAAGIVPAEIHDPWGHGLYATFRTRSFYTDRVKVEAHATPGTAPETRTTITPVTELADTLTLHSAGPDGVSGNVDDFVLATFTHARSQQSAREQTGQRTANQTVRSERTGALMGTVADPSGAVIPGATVVATNLTTQNEYAVKTEQDGTYLIDPIPAGEYDVHLSAPGFMDLIYHQVNVLTPDATVLDASLRVASESTTVEVSANAVTLNATSASLASVVVSAPRGLMTLLPGVVGAQATATPRLRDYFPETLVWRPEIITAMDGSATAKFRVADSITTWKLAAAASTREGNTGAGVAQFRSFQPFFAAFDPPRVLTIGDRIALPVTLRNYLDHAITVRSELKTAPWFRVEGEAAMTTLVPSADSASPVFRFTAIGAATDAPQQFLTKAAETGDNISRPVTVHPEGLPASVSTAGILKAGETTFTLDVPADAVAVGNDARLKFYPNLAAHIRDSLVEIAKYPDGCAEQITSTAWPSLLLQRYAAELPHPDKKLQKKTHEYLEEAYENLLDKQTDDGGFAYWSGDPYADAALTAYVIQFLTQAGEFIAVDEDVVKSAVAWLGKEQQKDGRWLRFNREHRPLAVGSNDPEDKIGSAMLTASIAAMIAGAPGTVPLVTKALDATTAFTAEFDEPYTLASYALAALALKDTAKSEPAIQRLRAMALTENGGAYWKLETNTPFFGWGRAGRVESTAQTLRALLAAGATGQDDLVARGLLFLDHEQDRQSLWYSTQATARVLDVLAAIALTEKAPAGRGGTGTLGVAIDGKAVTKARLPPGNEDAGPIFLALGSGMGAGEHRIKLTLPPTAGPGTAQIVADLYRPWPAIAPVSATTNNEQLRLGVSFSTTSPATGSAVEATAHIERIGFRGYGMLIAEIGLPPGADVDRASLESAIKASNWEINRYEVLPDRLLVYVWPKAGGLDVKFRFNLRYGVDALSAPSKVYDYYNPDSHFDVAPVRFTSR